MMSLRNMIVAMLLAVCVSGEKAQVKTHVKMQVSPIEKIIQMISELEQKIIKEGDEAHKAYTEFAEWCEDESKNLRFEIKTAKAEAEDLQSTIEKAAADIEAEEAKIEEFSGTIATDEADLKAATAIREKEHADFSAEEAELMSTADSLERAVGILERELPGGASLVQTDKDTSNLVQTLSVLVESLGISTIDKSRLTSLIQNQQQDHSNDDLVGAPAPDAYKSKSGGILDVLNDLLEKAQASLEEARKKETKAKQNYELLKLELTDAIKFATKELEQAKKVKAETQETKAVAEGDLAVVSKDLGEDMKTLGGIHNDCMTKASDYEVETQDRAAELKALATAKKIIIEKVALDQQGASFLQIKAQDDMDGAGPGFRATKLIRKLAKKVHSRGLLQLADRMNAAARMGSVNGDDPFAKVKGMINEMIEKLLKEAEADAAKKGYCDKEMGETKTKKDELSDTIEDLTAKIDQMNAESKKLKEEVAILSKELADLAKSQAEMDKLRKEEKEAFEAAKEELEEGIEGIQLALKVLKEYYAAGDSFLQKADGAAAGIIGMLEVAEADFTKSLEELIAAENTAVSEYEKTTKENEIAKTTKEQDVKYKTKEAKSLDKAAVDAAGDREGEQTELDAVNEYWEKIKGECIAKPDSYEEKKKRREAEIAGLKDALDILEGEAVLLQRSSHRVTRHGLLRGGQA